MLKKSLRLVEKEDFDRVFRNGKPLFFGEIGCRVALNSQKRFRLGFSFSKKHIPLAVERNRLRRLLSEACASVEWEEIRSKGVDIVFFSVNKPKKSTLLAYKAMAEQVKRAINQVKEA